MRSENRSNMVNLCSLLLKYDNFSKVEDDIFLYIDRILENVFEIHRKQTHANKELAALEEKIAEKQKRLHTIVNLRNSQSPAKKRKVQSLDSSLSACKENVSILEDSKFFPHKSDSDVSSRLEQNVFDSDEPFFALTQTPPLPGTPVRDVLSPRNEPSPKPSILRPAKLWFADDIKSPKKIIRESKFGTRLSAAAASPGLGVNPIVPSTVTPTSTSKWTGKKGKLESPISVEHTPTGLKRFHSLTDGNQRFRQAKLNFPRQTKQSPGNEPEQVANDALFSDFVIKTSPSVVNKSKFLRSLRMNKQSTTISKGQSVRSAAKSSSPAAAFTPTGEHALPRDDDEDINQTYCPGVESMKETAKDLSVKIKQEPASQQGKQRPAIKKTDCARNEQRSSNEDSETNEIILVKTGTQQPIITVAESQNENDEFITELLNEQAKRRRESTGLGKNSFSSNNVQRTKYEYGGLREASCNDCMKLYKFYIARGVANEAARLKLPHRCRGCQMAQLHNTPADFWDPNFIPTPE